MKHSQDLSAKNFKIRPDSGDAHSYSQKQGDFWVWGQTGLSSEIQDSQSYTEEHCPENNDKTTNKHKK